MSRRHLPSADKRRQDIWVGVSNMFPTSRGTYATPKTYAQVVGAGPASPGTTLRAWCGQIPAGTGVAYIGTTTKLYTTDLATFTDRSKVGGYTNTATSWYFEQYGNFTLATNNVDPIQVRDASGVGAFADLGGTPPTKAKILVVQSNAVLAFNITTGGQYWAASDVGNHANWTTGEAVTATPINHRPGPITAAVAFKGDVIVFKAASVYRMRYVGSPVYWLVELIADGIGAVNEHSAIVLGDAVLFIGAYGAYTFDGATFRLAGMDRSDSAYFATFTGIKSSVYWPATGSVWFATASGALVYNRDSDRWGSFGFYRASSASVLTSYVLLSGSQAAMAAAASALESAAYLADLSSNPCLLTSSGKWGDQGSVEASVLTGYMGQGEARLTNFKRVTPQLINHTFNSGLEASGTQMALTVYSFTASRDATLSSPAFSPVTSSTTQCRFDFNHTANLVQIQVACSVAPFEIDDISVAVVDGGDVP